MSRWLTGIVTWGVATGLAFLLCAQLNITLLQASAPTAVDSRRFGPTCWSPALSLAPPPSHCTTSAPILSRASMLDRTRLRPSRFGVLRRDRAGGFILATVGTVAEGGNLVSAQSH